MPDYVWIQNVVFPILGMGLGAGGMIAIYRLLRQWIDRKHERDMRETGAAPTRELEDLRARVAVLEETAYRVQEREERLDFTERVLARERQADRPALGEGH